MISLVDSTCPMRLTFPICLRSIYLSKVASQILVWMGQSSLRTNLWQHHIRLIFVKKFTHNLFCKPLAVLCYVCDGLFLGKFNFVKICHFIIVWLWSVIPLCVCSLLFVTFIIAKERSYVTARFCLLFWQVEKIDIKYAKTAKRIDVKKLKSTIWSLLTKDNSLVSFCKQISIDLNFYSQLFFLPFSVIYSEYLHCKILLTKFYISHLWVNLMSV